MVYQFSPVIKIINPNPYVDVSEDILLAIFRDAGTDKSPIPLTGQINGTPFQQSLVRYSGQWRLYINGAMAKAAGLRYKGSISAIVGRQVAIAMEFDTNPRTYELPEQFAKALANDSRANTAYLALPAGRRKEIARYLSALKNPDTLKRNSARILAHLRGEKTDALYALMHRSETK